MRLFGSTIGHSLVSLAEPPAEPGHTIMYGRGLEVIGGFATAPGATFTALTANAGTSFTVRNAPLESEVALVQAWADVQAAGVLRIRSPRLHDNVQGIRLATVISEPKPLLPWGVAQRLVPQDNLTVDITGSAVAGDIESAAMLIYYGDTPGIDANLISTEELLRRGVNETAVENTLALGITGGISGEESIAAEFDLLKANTEYALVGYLASAEAVCVRWRGIDTGNLPVGGPADETARDLTSNWFSRLSEEYGLPLIPVFNSANKNAILLDGAQDENGADVAVTSLLVELA